MSVQIRDEQKNWIEVVCEDNTRYWFRKSVPEFKKDAEALVLNNPEGFFDDNGFGAIKVEDRHYSFRRGPLLDLWKNGTQYGYRVSVISWTDKELTESIEKNRRDIISELLLYNDRTTGRLTQNDAVVSVMQKIDVLKPMMNGIYYQVIKDIVEKDGEKITYARVVLSGQVNFEWCVKYTTSRKNFEFCSEEEIKQYSGIIANTDNCKSIYWYKSSWFSDISDGVTVWYDQSLSLDYVKKVMSLGGKGWRGNIYSEQVDNSYCFCEENNDEIFYILTVDQLSSTNYKIKIDEYHIGEMDDLLIRNINVLINEYPQLFETDEFDGDIDRSKLSLEPLSPEAQKFFRIWAYNTNIDRVVIPNRQFFKVYGYLSHLSFVSDRNKEQFIVEIINTPNTITKKVYSPDEFWDIYYGRVTVSKETQEKIDTVLAWGVTMVSTLEGLLDGKPYRVQYDQVTTTFNNIQSFLDEPIEVVDDVPSGTPISYLEQIKKTLLDNKYPGGHWAYEWEQSVAENKNTFRKNYAYELCLLRNLLHKYRLAEAIEDLKKLLTEYCLDRKNEIMGVATFAEVDAKYGFLRSILIEEQVSDEVAISHMVDLVLSQETFESVEALESRIAYLTRRVWKCSELIYATRYINAQNAKLVSKIMKEYRIPDFLIKAFPENIPAEIVDQMESGQVKDYFRKKNHGLSPEQKRELMATKNILLITAKKENKAPDTYEEIKDGMLCSIEAFNKGSESAFVVDVQADVDKIKVFFYTYIYGDMSDIDGTRLKYLTQLYNDQFRKSKDRIALNWSLIGG